MADFKIVHDTVHGSIKLEGLFLDLLEAPAVQRLHGIHQLGLAYLVFPGANHTRLEHSLGTCHVAMKMAEALELSREEKSLVGAAAMLHDVGHSPYSHTLEMALLGASQKSHMDTARDIVTGKVGMGTELDCEDEETIAAILVRHGLEPQEVANLICGNRFGSEKETLGDFYTHDKQMIFNEKMYLPHIIHGSIDCDQIDYLLRDSFYTGVAHGTIDIDRLIQTIQIFNNDLVVHKRGIAAVEGMLVARALMYTSVYYHKTVRIAELMMARAFEALPETFEGITRMVDSELMAALREHGGFQRDITQMLKYRRLYKRAFTMQKGRASEKEAGSIRDLRRPEARRRAESDICSRAAIPKGYAIIDVPESELEITEPRIRSTNVKILDGTRLRPLSNYSPLARALEVRNVYDWDLMVSAAPRYLRKVEKVAKRVLFG